MMYVSDLWKHPSPEEIRQRDLEEAKRDLLSHQKNAEYATAMVKMLQERVKRLSKEK